MTIAHLVLVPLCECEFLLNSVKWCDDDGGDASVSSATSLGLLEGIMFPLIRSLCLDSVPEGKYTFFFCNLKKIQNAQCVHLLLLP